jgi:hypothetical protein
MPPESLAPVAPALQKQPLRYSECSYSVFISFATLDNDAYNRFVANFRDELVQALPGRLKGNRMAPVHFTGFEPKVAGSLSSLLVDAVRKSFAMFLFVHDNYVASQWCLKELEYFKATLGDAGFRDRLYVIAMSKSAIIELTESDSWTRLCPYVDQVWMPFFSKDDEDEPVHVYASFAEDRKVASEQFWTPFTKVVADLAKKIRLSVGAEPRAPAFPVSAGPPTLSGGPGRAESPVAGLPPTSAPPQDDLLVRVYIEAKPQHGKLSEGLGLIIAARWGSIIKRLRIKPELYLRATNLELTDLEQRPLLDDADGVVLLWSKKTPDALAAQIKKVEPKLAGPKPAPGLIAYVMEGEDDQPSGPAIGNWNVVRFLADADDAVLAVDDALLDSFLESVLTRKTSG